jgi:hypothetical protein
MAGLLLVVANDWNHRLHPGLRTAEPVQAHQVDVVVGNSSANPS